MELIIQKILYTSSCVIRHNQPEKTSTTVLCHIFTWRDDCLRRSTYHQHHHHPIDREPSSKREIGSAQPTIEQREREESRLSSRTRVGTWLWVLTKERTSECELQNQFIEKIIREVHPTVTAKLQDYYCASLKIGQLTKIAASQSSGRSRTKYFFFLVCTQSFADRIQAFEHENWPIFWLATASQCSIWEACDIMVARSYSVKSVLIVYPTCLGARQPFGKLEHKIYC